MTETQFKPPSPVKIVGLYWNSIDTVVPSTTRSGTQGGLWALCWTCIYLSSCALLETVPPKSQSCDADRTTRYNAHLCVRLNAESSPYRTWYGFIYILCKLEIQLILPVCILTLYTYILVNSYYLSLISWLSILCRNSYNLTVIVLCFFRVCNILFFLFCWIDWQQNVE